MRVIVTGGAGFIGSHIVEQLLAAGHEPHVIDNLSTGDRRNVPAGVTLHEVDVRNLAEVQKVFEAVRPQAVSHQAAQMSVSLSVREPYFDAEVNVMGLLSVLQAADRTGVERFVFASSGGVLYGDVDTPAPESHPADPVSPYGISKWVGERYLKFYSQQSKMTCIALRYSNVFGPRQNPHGEAGVVAIFCQRLLRGESATINGDGKYIRDYVYVTDVAAANVCGLTQPAIEPFRPYNVGTGQPTDTNQIGEAIHRECQRLVGPGKSVAPLNHGPARAGDLRSNMIDATRAKTDWGWTPQVDFASGLRQTVEWFHSQSSSSGH
ncbi:MAG: NAD-dependent epimerase/dehydratase family protein [Planctomycetaceae bacterium]